MRYFFDTEFIEPLHIIPRDRTWTEVLPGRILPLSIGMVREDGVELYFSMFHKPEWVTPWLTEHVMPHLHWLPEDYAGYETHFNLGRISAREQILNFVGNDPEPEFWTWYGAYDWVILCQLFERMIDMPSHWPNQHNDLKQSTRVWMREAPNEALSTMHGDAWRKEFSPEHHALMDARQLAWRYRTMRVTTYGRRCLP